MQGACQTLKHAPGRKQADETIQLQTCAAFREKERIMSSGGTAVAVEAGATGVEGVAPGPGHEASSQRKLSPGLES